MLTQRRASNASAPVATTHPCGVTQKGSFSCEARCLCPMGDTVWVGERSGLLSVRCARTGNVLGTIDPVATNHIFASAMIAVDNELWVGSTDGRLCVIDTESQRLSAELVNPESERGGEVFAIAVEGDSVFTATANCRVVEWNIHRKVFVKSFVHTKPVRGLATSPYSLFTADDGGNVCRWEIKTGDRMDSSQDSIHGITSLLMEEQTHTLWAARIDGTIDVYRTEPLTRVNTIRDAKGRLSCLLDVGGKVWGAGMDRTVFVWHASTHALLGKTKDHSAFIFTMRKLYTMETARIWSLSNDKTVNIYDGEGFFAPVRVLSEAQEEVTSAQSLVQNIRRENALLEKRLAIANEKLALNESEYERAKAENQQYVLKVHALEHVVDTKEESILQSTTKSTRMLDELEGLSKRIGELTMKLNQSESEKTTLKGDLARAEENLSRVRALVTEKTSKVALSETENTALVTDKARLAATVNTKEKENLDLGFQLKALRDELSCKSLDIAKLNAELDLAKTRVGDMEHEKSMVEQAKKFGDEEARRLMDTVLLRENEVRELTTQLAMLTNKHNNTSTSMSTMEAQAQLRSAEAKRLEDSYALRTHEFDLIKSEKDNLLQALQHEKAQTHDARAAENKLRLQNDELRRQLESEKAAVKMLEDQYTIFQFVINSRGELVQAIWELYAKLDAAQKALRSVDVAVKHIDPTKDKIVLKHEWKTNVCAKAQNSLNVMNEVTEKADYIVCNYFSEYEKMHLGVSASKFTPDAARPVIVGDELLTKLRDVTLNKQFATSKPAAAAVSASRYQPINSTILPPPHDATMGPQHVAPLGSSGGFGHSF